MNPRTAATTVWPTAQATPTPTMPSGPTSRPLSESTSAAWATWTVTTSLRLRRTRSVATTSEVSAAGNPDSSSNRSVVVPLAA